MAPGTLLRGASYQDGLELEVSGWDNPTVRFGNVSFQVGTEARPMAGTEFYASYLGEIYFSDLWNGLGSNPYIVNPDRGARHGPNLYRSAFQESVITVPKAAPGVYGIAMQLDLDDVQLDQPTLTSSLPWSDAVLFSAERADAQGRVSFALPNEPLRFVESFTAESEPGTVVLVRLSGTDLDNGWYEVVVPKHVATK